MLLLASLAAAAQLAGVTLPDSATLGGQPVRLNGIGLREKYFIDVYVGALYLKTPTRDAQAAIKADEPKRIVMHFIYDKVTHEQLVDTWVESVGGQPNGAQAMKDTEQLLGWMPDAVYAGEEMVFDYVPGVGTTLTIKGKKAGTIPGKAFMELVWGVFLGPAPPTAALKAGMLGRSG